MFPALSFTHSQLFLRLVPNSLRAATLHLKGLNALHFPGPIHT